MNLLITISHHNTVPCCALLCPTNFHVGRTATQNTKMVNWTPEADTKLFLTILAVHDLKINYAEVAKRFGQETTAKAISRRMDKLRELAGKKQNDVKNEAGLVQSSPTKARKNQKVLEGGVVKRSVIKKE
jgi:hypothetical protein